MNAFFVISILFLRSCQLRFNRIVVLFLQFIQFDFQTVDQGFIARFIIDIMHFHRIVLQIIKFPHIDIIIEMD